MRRIDADMKEKLRIYGNERLEGEVAVSGGKNAAVAIIPAALLLSRIWGPNGVWNAFWISEGIAAVFSVCVYRRSVRRLPR